MPTEWKLFADLAEHAGDRRITVDTGPGDTVEDALDALLAGREQLRERVLDEDGELRSQINVLRNGTNVHSLDAGFETELEGNDELALFPPVSGGCHE